MVVLEGGGLFLLSEVLLYSGIRLGHPSASSPPGTPLHWRVALLDGASRPLKAVWVMALERRALGCEDRVLDGPVSGGKASKGGPFHTGGLVLGYVLLRSFLWNNQGCSCCFTGVPCS